MPTWAQYLPYIIVPLLLAIPLGKYISHIINDQNNFMSRIIRPIENKIYKFFRVSNREMSWKTYLLSILMFSLVSFLVLFSILKF